METRTTEIPSAQVDGQRLSTAGERMLNLLAEFAASNTPVSPGTRLEDLAIDSLDMVELVKILDEEHGVRLDRAAFEAVVTVHDALEAVERRARELNSRRMTR